MYESVVWNWRDASSPKGKEKAYKLDEIVFRRKGVGGEHSTDNDCARKRSLWEGSLRHSLVVERVRARIMSCRLITPKKKFDNFKTNYIYSQEV